MPSDTIAEQSLIPRASPCGSWEGDVGSEMEAGVEAEEGAGEQAMVPKDGKLAWTVCVAGFLLQVLIVGMLHVFGVFFVEFIREFKKTKGEVAWVGSAAYGLSMAFGPVTGILVNRWGNRPVTMAGCFICAVSTLVSSFAGSVETLFLTYSVLYGIGTSLAYTPTMTIAQDYFDKYVSVATGIMTAGSSTGTLVLAPLSQYLVDSFGWRVAFRFFTGTSLFTVGCAMMFRPLPTNRPAPADRVRKSPLSHLKQELSLWKDRVFLVWVAAITLVMFGYYIPYVHMVSYAKDVGVPPDQGSMLVMLLGGSTAAGRIMFGKIVQYSFLDRLHMHQLAMVVTGTGAMILPLITSFGGLAAYVVCVGLVDGCFVVLLPLLTATLVGADKTVVAWGFLVGASSITFMLGPPIAGWIDDYTGSYNIAFHVAGIPIVLGALVLFLIPWARRTSSRPYVLDEIEVREEGSPEQPERPTPTPLVSSPMCGTHSTTIPLNNSSRCFSIGSIGSAKNVSLAMTNILDNGYRQLEDGRKATTSQNQPSNSLGTPLVAASLPANLNLPTFGCSSNHGLPSVGKAFDPACTKKSSSSLKRELFQNQKQLMLAAGRVRAKSWSESGTRYQEIHVPQVTRSERHSDLISSEARSQLTVDNADKRRGIFGQPATWRSRQMNSSDTIHISETSAVSSDRNYLADVSQQPSENSLIAMFDGLGVAALSRRANNSSGLLNEAGASSDLSSLEQMNQTSIAGSSLPFSSGTSVTSSPTSPQQLVDLSDVEVGVAASPRQRLPARLSSSTSPVFSSQEKLPTISEGKPFHVTESAEGTGSDRVADAVSDLVQIALIPSGGEG